MAWPTPVSYHIDLYTYWCAKRGLRRMPARDDLSAADLIPLLPHLIISEREGDKFRHKLFGTHVVRDLGFDATGYFVGEYLDNQSFHSEARAAYDTVCALRDPIFAAGEFCFELFGCGAHHDWSILMLPLSNDEVTINKIIASFIARLRPDLRIRRDWLEQQPAKVLKVADFEKLDALKQLCLEWECQSA